jgi:hypothetical protein
MAAESAALQALLEKNDLPATVLTELAKEPYGIVSLANLANYFDTKTEIKTLFTDKIDIFKDNGKILANLRQTYREAEADVNRNLKKRETNAPEQAEDDPLPQEIADTLTTLWKSLYKWDIPPSWMGSPQMVGKFHRGFKKRSHTGFILTKIRTQESLQVMVVPEKRQRLSETTEILFRNESEAKGILPLGTCHTYLYGLKVTLYTMSFAGTFRGEGGLAPLVFAPLQQLIDHLATAESWCWKHLYGDTRFSDTDVLSTLKLIDQNIRDEWGRAVRTTSKTLGEIVDDLKSYQAALWLHSPTSLAPTPQMFAGSGRLGRVPNPRSSKGGKDKGGKGGKGGSSTLSIKDTPYPGDGGSGRFKTCRTTQDDLAICKPFNDGRGCSHPKCSYEHVCDVLLPNGKNCGKGHPRTKHRGSKVPI